MLGVIGIGAAGGNIADEAIKYDIPSIAINYSESDLNSLENVVDKLFFVGSEGVGKQREEAIRLMNNNWESATSFVKKHMSAPSIEVIMVVFSTGGGSGSGISPILVEMLQNEMPDKVFVPCPIIPDKSEVIVNQVNCLNAFEELSRLECLVLPIDNQKVKENYGVSNKSRLFQIINNRFVKELFDLVSYTEKYSKYGILDKKDFRQIFTTSGIGIISTLDISKLTNQPIELSEDGITNAINNSWKKSIYAPFSKNRIIRAGIVYDGQESFMQYLNYESVFSHFNNMPTDLFEGNYNEDNGKIISILAGLPWINERLREIDELIEEKKASISHDNDTYVSKNNRKDFFTNAQKPNKPKRSVSDILSKYQR